MEEIQLSGRARQPLRRRDGRLSLDISDQVIEFCPYCKSPRVELAENVWEIVHPPERWQCKGCGRRFIIERRTYLVWEEGQPARSLPPG